MITGPSPKFYGTRDNLLDRRRQGYPTYVFASATPTKAPQVRVSEVSPQESHRQKGTMRHTGLRT